MARIKNSFTPKKIKQPVDLGSDSSSLSSLSKTALPRDLAAKILNPSGASSVAEALKYGTLHTKATPVSSSSGSQWTSLLGAATGGVSSLIGGGLLSSGGFGFIGKLLSLFGSSKSTPAAPVPFQSPVSRQNSLNITVPGAASLVSLGVHSLNVSGSGSGVYQPAGSTVPDHAQSAQVVQIVKQALLTSSSLNDVIAEI